MLFTLANSEKFLSVTRLGVQRVRESTHDIRASIGTVLVHREVFSYTHTTGVGTAKTSKIPSLGQWEKLLQKLTP